METFELPLSARRTTGVPPEAAKGKIRRTLSDVEVSVLSLLAIGRDW